MKIQLFPFFCNNHKTLSHLELNFQRRLLVMDSKVWKLGNVSQVITSNFPQFYLGNIRPCNAFIPTAREHTIIWWIITMERMLGYATRLGQSCASQNISKNVYDRSIQAFHIKINLLIELRFMCPTSFVHLNHSRNWHGGFCLLFLDIFVLVFILLIWLEKSYTSMLKTIKTDC